MSTPNPTQVIAEGMREVATEGQKGTPGTREDGQLWGAFPNTMTLTDLAEHVVSKLTDAGYSIMPTEPSTNLITAVMAERITQIEQRGYDVAHDAAHGVEGLHELAEQYALKGDDASMIKALALLFAAHDVRAAASRPTFVAEEENP